MTLPDELQIFEHPVILLDKDAERLKPFLSSWVVLAQLFLLGVNEPDVQRLIVLELLDRRRPLILDRLTMRLGRLQRQRVAWRIKQAIKALERPIEPNDPATPGT